jgi:DNA-binding transcriptional ArsR family regulator
VKAERLGCVAPARSAAELRELRDRLAAVDARLRWSSARFALLAGETRLKILHLLDSAGELCVCDLATILEMTPAAVSQHLSRLRSGRMVSSRRDGMTIYYRLAEEADRRLLAPVLGLGAAERR